MVSLEPFVYKIKPAMDAFLRVPTSRNLQHLEEELSKFNWVQMRIFQVQILMPLLMKLEELMDHDLEIRTGILNCIRLVSSNLYLNDIKGLRTLLVIVLKQIRDVGNATGKPNLSEEIKLAAVQCITVAMQRSTTDVLESFYNRESSMLLGEILLTLVEFMEFEKYRKLITASIQSLMTVFYVHDEADSMDVVLRNQVANTLFIYLPKVVSVLFKMCLADEKLGETMKSATIRVLGRILCLVFEETDEAVVKNVYNMHEFKQLVVDILQQNEVTPADTEMFDKCKKNELESRLQSLQNKGRNRQWFDATSQRLHPMLNETMALRSHQSMRIRKEYAQMCCTLIIKCPNNLRDNIIFLLENVVAMSEDEEPGIRKSCQQTLQRLQNGNDNEWIFDEKSEFLFDEHLRKLPRIINRCDDAEQYAEFSFLKGFLRNLSVSKLQQIFLIPKNTEMLCMCLLSAINLRITRDLLNEDYSFREPRDSDYTECAKLHWRQFKNLSSQRCIQTVMDICGILGRTNVLNRILFDYLLELSNQQTEAMNEILLIMLWIATAPGGNKANRLEMVDMLMEELLDDKHWNLSLQPDHEWRLKVEKPTHWFVDRTPGLFESAIEVRTQDCDSDDEDATQIDTRKNCVTIADAQFNVLHSCIVLDCLGQCTQFIGETFDKYVFRSLHKVLLKVASSNSSVHQAATFALISMQKALKLIETSHFIELNTDYLSYHLNTILRRSPESNSAVDILTVVLQYSSPKALPHLDAIFQTIRNECSKSSQSENVPSYLRVYNAFLTHITRWHINCQKELNDEPIQMDAEEKIDLATVCLNILQKPAINCVEDITSEPMNEISDSNVDEPESDYDEGKVAKPELPQYIEMVKEILHQTFKFVSTSAQTFQILALECLIKGIPLLSHYEDELLPLVHLIWQPLVEKFRQKDALVLNRCFTLLSVLATHAKDFILKRSLDDVVPFLMQFLKEAAGHSATKTTNSHTQEYKLQLKLLQEFPNLIQSMQIEGKHLNDIFEIITLYLADVQPKQLQDTAVDFYKTMCYYNRPLVYLVITKRSHLKDYKENTERVCSVWKL